VALGVEVVGVSCGLVPLSATSQPRRTWEFEWYAEWCAQFRHARCSLSHARARRARQQTQIISGAPSAAVPAWRRRHSSTS